MAELKKITPELEAALIAARDRNDSAEEKIPASFRSEYLKTPLGGKNSGYNSANDVPAIKGSKYDELSDEDKALIDSHVEQDVRGVASNPFNSRVPIYEQPYWDDKRKAEEEVNARREEIAKDPEKLAELRKQGHKTPESGMSAAWSGLPLEQQLEYDNPNYEMLKALREARREEESKKPDGFMQLGNADISHKFKDLPPDVMEQVDGIKGSLANSANVPAIDYGMDAASKGSYLS